VCWNQGSRQCPSSSSLEARPAARFRLGDSVAAASRHSQSHLELSSISGAAYVGPSAQWHPELHRHLPPLADFLAQVVFAT
jgi:hypothetical protein